MIVMAMSKRRKNVGKRPTGNGRGGATASAEDRDAAVPDMKDGAAGGEKPKKPVVLEVKRAPEKIIRQLDRLRWNQKRLSVETGIQESRISRWLDKDGNPKPLQFLAIARALGVTVDYLIDDHQDEVRPLLDPDEKFILETASRLGLKAAIQRLLATTLDEGSPPRDAKQGRDSDPNQPPGRKDQAG
jgi:transcriptional regulator with XRE-family HTH domain